MTIWQALLLGLVQGATEFFPISSSAHLSLMERLLGLPQGESMLFFHVVCHSGTLLALVWFLRAEIGVLLLQKDRVISYIVALAPLVPVYFLLKPLRLALSAPQYLPYFLALTGSLLFVTSRVRQRALVTGTYPEKTGSMLCIGMVQACALIPGLSRSGSTMAAARLLFGWSWSEAAKVSFLLSIPAILGGQCLETLRLFSSQEKMAMPGICYAVAFVASFAVGTLALRGAFWMYRKEKILPLALYCLGMALFLMAWD